MKFVFDEKDVIKSYNSKIVVMSDGSIKVTNYKKNINFVPDGYEPISSFIEPKFNKKGRVSSDSNKNKNNELKKIRVDSLSRTRNTLIEYACENAYLFKSFVTLTFADNITNITEANKKFGFWHDAVKKYCNNHNIPFVYLGVPEFQKRGAVHYHLLTSLSCGCDILPKRNEPLMLWNKDTEKWSRFDYTDIKYWRYGWSSAFDIVNDTDENFNVALYITKYLYKDLDNRLFGRNRILKSNGLKKACVYKLMQDSDTYLNAIEEIKKYDIKSSYSFGGDSERPYIIPFDTTNYKIRCLENVNLLKDILKN